MGYRGCLMDYVAVQGYGREEIVVRKYFCNEKNDFCERPFKCDDCQHEDGSGGKFENVDFEIPDDGSILFRVASQLVWHKP